MNMPQQNLNPHYFFVLCYIINTFHCAKIPLLIDTDIGSDFDDAGAVTYSLSRQDLFDIKLILTSSFNTTGRAQLTAKMLHYMNNSHIDIGIGYPTPCPQGWNCNNVSLDHVGPQWPWAKNYEFDSYGPGKIYFNGIQRATEILTAASPSNPIWILAIGPYANLAQIFLSNPSLKANARLFTTEAFTGNGYNAGLNVSAAEIVFNYTDKTPYNNSICNAAGQTTYWFQIYDENYQNLLNSRNISVLSDVFIQNYQVWYENGGDSYGANRPYSPDIATSTMWDLQTAYMLGFVAETNSCSNIQWINMEKYKTAINDSGYFNVLPENSPLQTEWEALSWTAGNDNGTYDLGTFVVDCITKL
eukprot:193030_1